jgi:predicted nucleic acid-binding protein
MPFLDTNVLLRHLLSDHAVLSPKATAIIRRVEDGGLQVRTSDIVIFETVYTLNRTYRHPRDAITDALLPLIELEGMRLPGKRLYRRVFAIYKEGRLGLADCYHVALMEQLDINEILSFDTDFDRVPDLVRREA